jgi:hypothetical protein
VHHTRARRQERRLPLPDCAASGRRRAARGRQRTRRAENRVRSVWTLFGPRPGIEVSTASVEGVRASTSSSSLRWPVCTISLILPARSFPIPRRPSNSSPAAIMAVALRGRSSMVCAGGAIGADAEGIGILDLKQIRKAPEKLRYVGVMNRHVTRKAPSYPRGLDECQVEGTESALIMHKLHEHGRRASTSGSAARSKTLADPELPLAVSRNRPLLLRHSAIGSHHFPPRRRGQRGPSLKDACRCRT